MDTARVLVDRQRFGQVMSNLLSNALRHTPAGGQVRISVHRQGASTALIHVADDGEGIPPGQLGHIFERFYRGVLFLVTDIPFLMQVRWGHGGEHLPEGVDELFAPPGHVVPAVIYAQAHRGFGQPVVAQGLFEGQHVRHQQAFVQADRQVHAGARPWPEFAHDPRPDLPGKVGRGGCGVGVPPQRRGGNDQLPDAPRVCVCHS